MRIMSFSGLFSRLSFTGSDKATRASRDAEEEVSSTEQFPPLAVKVNGFLEEGVEGGKQNGVATLEQEPTPTRPKSKPPATQPYRVRPSRDRDHADLVLERGHRGIAREYWHHARSTVRC